jgi:hypothetical protein
MLSAKSGTKSSRSERITVCYMQAGYFGPDPTADIGVSLMAYLGDLDSLGDSGVGPNVHVNGSATVKAAGGAATAWPFSTGLYAQAVLRPSCRAVHREPATLVRRTPATSAAQAIAQATANNQYIYVLAPDDVAADAPKTMTTIQQRSANAIFTTGDRAADAAGLPSLNAVSRTR